MSGKIFGEQSELIYSINMLFLVVVCENQLKAFSIGSPMTAVMEFINDLVFQCNCTQFISFKCPIPGIATFREENFHVPARLVTAAAAVVQLHHLLGFC